jgi:hypothetical protein
MQQKQKNALLVQAAEPNAAASGGNAAAAGIQTEFFKKHLAKIAQKLQSAKGLYRENLLKERERAIQKEREFKIKGKSSVDLAKALLREEERRLQMMKQMMQKLATIGKCPQEFAWRWENPLFHCEGGSHHASPEQLGVTASDCIKFFGVTGVMKLD